MAKSEISLLQELSVKQGFIPTYDFTEKRINAVSIQFTCYVFCKELKAHGIGYTKKEAKHDAARNMLSLLAINDKTSLPVDTLASDTVASSVANTLPVDTLALNTVASSVANTLQSPVKVCEKTVDRNYVGLLQEFCQQQKIEPKDILYELVSDEGLPHVKTFTMQVSLKSLRERGKGQCKKSAKQEAAKKLLLRLDPNVANIPDTKIDVHNVSCNIETLENDIRKLGTGISDCVINKETLPVTKLSEKAKSLYLEYFNQMYKGSNQEINPSLIKNFHISFEKNYSHKIPYNMKEKMQIIRDSYTTDQTDLMYEIRRDIEKSFKVKIQQFTIHSIQKNHMICLRLLSNPCITQVGIGETKVIAEYRATYNLVAAILILLNV